MVRWDRWWIRVVVVLPIWCAVDPRFDVPHWLRGAAAFVGAGLMCAGVDYLIDTFRSARAHEQ